MIKGIGLTALALFIYPVVSLYKNRNQFILREYDSKQNFTVLISFVFVIFLSYILLSTMSGIWFLPRNFLIFLPFCQSKHYPESRFQGLHDNVGRCGYNRNKVYELKGLVAEYQKGRKKDYLYTCLVF